jgi:hypothetical protein
MGLLQGIIAVLRNSAKRLVDAIFGWAVDALFGSTTNAERPLLAAVVGAGGFWPFLLLGIPFPKVAAFVLLLIPIPSWVSSGTVRIVWIAATIAVPIGVGIVLAHRGIGDSRQPFAVRLLRGIPVTAALGAAFFVAVLTSPIRRMIAFARGWKDEHMPLLIDKADYFSVADQVREILAKEGLPLERAPAPFLLVAPSRVLRTIGGKTFEDRIPRDLQFFQSPPLEIAVHSTGITLQGEKTLAARAHALLGEKATFLAGLQTTDPDAHKLEKRLKQLWNDYVAEGEEHPRPSFFARRLDAISADLATTFLDYGEWQILYREILQVSRAIRGRPQLLEAALRESEERRSHPNLKASRTPRRPRIGKRLRRGARKTIRAEDRFAGLAPKLFEGLINRIFPRH